MELKRSAWQVVVVAAIWAVLASNALGATNLSLRATSETLSSETSSQSLALARYQDEDTSQTSTEEETTSVRSDSRHPQWVLDLESKMWPGFLTGLSGYEDFVMPVGQFTYFEDPFITTDLRLMYVYHDIPDRSVLRGGQVHLIAAQIRVALTERLAFIATKDGYSWVDSGITASGDGFNDIAAGIKYAVYSNPDEHFLVSSGIRWEWSNGSSDAFQGGAQELSPFISMAKGWDKFHFIGAVTGRIPTNRHKGNYSLVWNLHLDYELTETFRPLIEFHGIHWLSNGGILPISTDYLDVGSLGASKVRGHDFFSAGIGFRWQLMENVSLGVTWEFPLESPAENLQQNRVTVNTVISF